jgi:demethylmenaquinone methyltransferase / 2-methoxy-6-polyprenyl-1,4-benzoquinol methylase
LHSLRNLKNPDDKAGKVRDMFGAIAGRYDFLNHFLSANLDRRWRKISVREIEKRLAVSNPRILDVGCGTADLSLAFSRLGSVTGCDFCHPMLRLGMEKITGSQVQKRVFLLESDALELPFADAVFDVVVSAFVLRNLADMDRGLREMRRVLRPGGLVGILDFGMPTQPFFAALYRFYFARILPKVGRLLSGVNGPYLYLPNSVQAFPPVEELKKKAGQAGFINVQHKLLTLGVAVLLVGNTQSN